MASEPTWALDYAILKFTSSAPGIKISVGHVGLHNDVTMYIHQLGRRYIVSLLYYARRKIILRTSGQVSTLEPAGSMKNKDTLFN